MAHWGEGAVGPRKNVISVYPHLLWTHKLSKVLAVVTCVSFILSHNIAYTKYVLKTDDHDKNASLL